MAPWIELGTPAGGGALTFRPWAYHDQEVRFTDNEDHNTAHAGCVLGYEDDAGKYAPSDRRLGLLSPEVHDAPQVG